MSQPLQSNEIPVLPLNDGSHSGGMPSIGVGVYRSDPGEETFQQVLWALEVGYRLIDTAAMYGNEEDVGRAIVASGLSRNEIWITTKLDTNSHGFQRTIKAALKSQKKLAGNVDDTDDNASSLPPIDLLLIHSPYGEKIVETWDAMLELQKHGAVRHVGVSNFGIPHLEAIRQNGRPMPTVNQIELHPLNYRQRRQLLEYCQHHSIQITAYGSLFGTKLQRRTKDQPLLTTIAEQYNKTIPQILLRWGLEVGVAIIPKSASSRTRLEENFNIIDFQLSGEEIQSISTLEGKPLNEYWNPIDDASVDIGDLTHAASAADDNAQSIFDAIATASTSSSSSSSSSSSDSSSSDSSSSDSSSSSSSSSQQSEL